MQSLCPNCKIELEQVVEDVFVNDSHSQVGCGVYECPQCGYWIEGGEVDPDLYIEDLREEELNDVC